MKALTELIPLADSDRKKLSRLFDPLNDNVILAVDSSEKTTPGGIILVESSNSNMTTQSGTVVAHGPGAVSPVTGERIPLSVHVGDRVLFAQYAGGDLSYGDVQLKTLREPDIISRVNDDDVLQPEGLRVRKKAGKKAGKGPRAKAKA